MVYGEEDRTGEADGAQRTPRERKVWSRPVVILASAEETAVKGTRVGDYTASGLPAGS